MLLFDDKGRSLRVAASHLRAVVNVPHVWARLGRLQCSYLALRVLGCSATWWSVMQLVLPRGLEVEKCASLDVARLKPFGALRGR